MPLNAVQLIRAIGGKTLTVPEGGWHAHTFAQHGPALLRALVRTAKITQMRAIPVLARLANEIFSSQLEKVIAIALGKVRKDTIREIMLPNHEAIWHQAIEQVFKEANVEVVTKLVPPIQSVLDQGYSKTSILMGHEAVAGDRGLLAGIARTLAQKITRINETTRAIFQRHIADSIEKGATVAETVKDLRETIPEINASRQLTIARTELNRSWTLGSAASFKENKSITHVSVIGCEAAEPPPSPQYHGRSTCNYPDLPIAELDAFLEVGFHPNHGGTLIPSGFRHLDGHVI